MLLLQHDLEVKQLQDTIAELVARYDEQIAFLTEENRTLSNLVAELQARVDELSRALKASETRVRLRSYLFSQLSDLEHAYRNSQHATFLLSVSLLSLLLLSCGEPHNWCGSVKTWRTNWLPSWSRLQSGRRLLLQCEAL